MSTRELDRAQLMRLIRERRRTQAQVAEQLGVERPARRALYKAFKAGGATSVT